jgi:hypothetical protein
MKTLIAIILVLAASGSAKAEPVCRWTNGAIIPCAEYDQRMRNLRNIPLPTPREDCLFYSRALLPQTTRTLNSSICN